MSSQHLRYHHARPLTHVRAELVIPVRETDVLAPPTCATHGAECPDDDWHAAHHMESGYAWLARRIGFWPLFLAVGTTDEDRRMTGYQNQWSRSPQLWGDHGPPRDTVLFSWTHPPPGTVYQCFHWWHSVLNGQRTGGWDHHGHEVLVDKATAREVLQLDWDAARWLRRAAKEPHSVQAAVAMLDLRTADTIWAPNQHVARQLRDQGFDSVDVQRLRIS